MSYARTAVTRMTLDMSRLDLQRSETVTLGDTNRRWEVTLINGGAPFRLPPNWTAALTGIKPDGTGLLNGCSVADGKIIYDFAAGAEIATCAGSYPVQFDIWDEVGDLVASPKIYVNVLADVRPHAELDSEGQYTLIGNLIGRVNQTDADVDLLGETALAQGDDIAALKEKITTAGSVTIPPSAWDEDDVNPYAEIVSLGGDVFGAGDLVLISPEDDETKAAAEAAGLTVQVDGTMDTNAVDHVVLARAESGTAPDVTLNLRYVVIHTADTELPPVVSLVGVDGGIGGGLGSGVDETAVKKIINTMLGNVANVRQYSADNPPPYPVTSVNGKTGTVALTAADVGADESGTAASKVAAHNTDLTAHADIREDIEANAARLDKHDTAMETLTTAVAERLKTADLTGKLDSYVATKNLVNKAVSDLTNYYSKSQTLSKDEINALVSAIPRFSIAAVTSLPTSNISSTTVYLVKSGSDESNLYTEWIYVDGTWEKLGTQTVDLSGYVTTEALDAKLEEYATLDAMASTIATALAPYSTTEQMTEAIAAAVVNFATTAQVSSAISAALGAYYTKTQTDAAITNALVDRPTKEEMGTAITNALADYYNKTEADGRFQPLGDYAKSSDIPTALPNPKALTILGKTYNGSSAVALTVEELIEAIKTASGGVVVWIGADNNIYLSGNLSDDTYKAYFVKDGEYIEIGELTLGEEEPVTYTITFVADGVTVSTKTYTVENPVVEEPAVPVKEGYTGVWETYDLTKGGNITVNAVYTEIEPTEAVNLLPQATNADGTAYNDGQGWKTGYKISTSSGYESAASGIEVTGFMPITYGQTLTIDNIETGAAGFGNICLYDGNHDRIIGGTLSVVLDSETGGSAVIDSKIFTELTSSSGLTYFRISAAEITADTVITVTD